MKLLISTVLVLLIAAVIYAEVAHIGQSPHGVNPTLYDAKRDPIIQLDASSFNDTVFCNGPIENCTAFLIERWQKVIKVAAMNCADPVNEMTCRDNGVQFFPFIKYYPRNATDAYHSSRMRPLQTLAEMRDQLTQAILTEYANNKYSDWPVFDFLGDVKTYTELWSGTPQSVGKMAIVFEGASDSLIGAQLLLDMSRYDDELTGRRCLKSHPLVEALHIKDFPAMAIYKRGERRPILNAELRRMLFNELEMFLSQSAPQHFQKQLLSNEVHSNFSSIDCDLQPEICRTRYYVSELDILKATRYALYREVARFGDNFRGSNLTALYVFMSALAEEKNGLPFPIKEDWEHCKGSDPKFRGYTCGLWTTFHTLTIQSFLNGFNDTDFNPLSPLQAVRGWVDNFFGCRYCRDHFIRMTTKTFPMDVNVRKPDDVFMYLWRAHNIVNARLKGRDTEDPEFIKYQFPAPFLCANCTENRHFNRNDVKRFLLDFYTTIMPFRKAQNSD
ncbi:unnamed protein product [Anisakis simplex]|uniref:Sulfhydryl oxidase n=1 Tax=Anisakis simplex TaxID=6269 RepID=A0A0M3K460_ANISI|nr:unnamed protein product [Anisakis simplex]